MKYRSFIKRLHFYVALIAALPLLVLCISGSLLVYREPIDEWFARSYLEVPVGTEKLPIAAMEQKLKDQFPDHVYAGVVIPREEGRSYSFWLKGGPSLWTVAYVDPYTGVFKGLRAWEDWTLANFIWWLTDLHYCFKWGDPGSYLVGASSIILAISMVSGIYLWWPRKSRFDRHKFTLRRGRRWRQTAYNLHAVIGIYFAAILLVICVTGVAITFWEPMRKFVHAVTLSPPPREHLKAAPIAGGKLLPYEELLARGQAFLQERYNIAPTPEAITFADAENAAVEISFQGNPSLTWADHHHVWVHSQTGQIVDSEVPKAFNRGETVVSWIGPLHFGGWGALIGPSGDHASRVTWLIAALVPLFLMITGFSVVKKSQWLKFASKKRDHN